MSWITTVANGAIGFGQSLFNNWLAKRSADNQYQRQLDFWNKQNAYNSPQAQRQRFQSAGINPNSVTGQMATAGTSQGLSSVPGNEYAQSGVLKLEGLAQTLETMARIEKIGAETGLLSEQTLTEIIRQTYTALGIPEKEVETSIKRWEERSASKRYNRLDEYIDAEIRRIYAQGSESAANASSTSTKLPYEIEKINSEISLNDMTTILRDAQTEEAKAAAANQYAQSRLTQLNADITQKYGDAKAAADLKDSQTKADYCAALLQSSIDLQSSTIMLNQNQALTNEARVIIEQQAQDLKERYLELDKDKFALEKNKFELEAVKSAIDVVISILGAATPW